MNKDAIIHVEGTDHFFPAAALEAFLILRERLSNFRRVAFFGTIFGFINFAQQAVLVATMGSKRPWLSVTIMAACLALTVAGVVYWVKARRLAVRVAGLRAEIFPPRKSSLHTVN